MANLSGKPRESLRRMTNSNRLVLFACLLGGQVIWMGYRASLFSALSVRKSVLPFDGFSSLLDTNFQ